MLFEPADDSTADAKNSKTKKKRSADK